MGHRCCSKQKVKRGLWSPEEDEKLVNFITSHGHPSWSSVPKLAGLQRCGKSCRLRWINYLRPDLKRGTFTEEEERTIIEVHRILGNRWAQIAKHLPGRTDNEVKNFWNSCIKKKLLAQGLDPNTHNLLSRSPHKSSTTVSVSQSINNSINPLKQELDGHEVFTVSTIKTQKKDTPLSTQKERCVSSSLQCNAPSISPSSFGLSVIGAGGQPVVGGVNGASSNGCVDHLEHGFGLVDEDPIWVDPGFEKFTSFGDQQQQAAVHPNHLQQQENNVGMEEAELRTMKDLEMGFQSFDHGASFGNNGGSAFDFGFGDYSVIMQGGMLGDVVGSMDQVAWDIVDN